MSTYAMDVYERVKELDHHDKCCILAMLYAIGDDPATDDDILQLRNGLTQEQWWAHIAFLETGVAEVPGMAAFAELAIQFIRERILEEGA